MLGEYDRQIPFFSAVLGGCISHGIGYMVLWFYDQFKGSKVLRHGLSELFPTMKFYSKMFIFKKE